MTTDWRVSGAGSFGVTLPTRRRASGLAVFHRTWGGGIALVFARTETAAFHEHVWNKADAIYFLKGRIRFFNVNGKIGGSAPAPSVLVAYGDLAKARLASVKLPAGKLITL